VVVGDHGEGFGEHGRKQHDSVLYEEGLHVPLVIHDPGEPREHKIAPLVTQLDILPTVLSLAGWTLDVPLRGQDMRELREDRRLFGYCWYDRSCASMLDGTLKVIHYFGRRPDEAFDLAKDPDEKRNIASSVRDLSSRVREVLAWRGSVRGAYADYYKELLSEIVSPVMHEGITHPLRFEMGDYLEFLGYDLSEDGPVRARSEVTITFYYRVLRRIPAGWRLSTQGLTDRGDWVSLDHEPVEGLYPMSQWQSGQYIKDVYTMRLSSKLRPGGSLKVVQGLYRSRSGKKTQHAPISGQPADDKQKVELFTLAVKPLGQP
jgi:lipoteichoic acid synthase